MPSKATNGNLTAAGGTLSVDQVVKGATWLTVIVQVGSAGTPAVAGADVNSWVIPYLEDGSTLLGGNGALLQADSSSAATLNGSKAIRTYRYRLGGVAKVQITLQNANATTALPGQIDWFTG